MCSQQLAFSCQLLALFFRSFCFLLWRVPGIEPRASHMQGKSPMTLPSTEFFELAHTRVIRVSIPFPSATHICDQDGWHLVWVFHPQLFRNFITARSMVLFSSFTPWAPFVPNEGADGILCTCGPCASRPEAMVLLSTGGLRVLVVSGPQHTRQLLTCALASMAASSTPPTLPAVTQPARVTSPPPSRPVPSL